MASLATDLKSEKTVEKPKYALPVVERKEGESEIEYLKRQNASTKKYCKQFCKDWLARCEKIRDNEVARFKKEELKKMMEEVRKEYENKLSYQQSRVKKLWKKEVEALQKIYDEEKVNHYNELQKI